MNVFTRTIFLILILAAVGRRPTAAQSTEETTGLISAVLDNVHSAAAAAEFDRYFAQYTADAIFFGTDPEERWTIADFKAYATPAFKRGGWTYHPSERHIFIGEGGRTAWFDESLENENYGTTRGTGVLVLTGQGWRVSQYNLSIPVPNDLALSLVEEIRAFHEKK